MTVPEDGRRETRARAAATALAVTLAIQIFASFAATATPVLAPEIGRELGIAPRLIGLFVGLVYAGAMIGSLGAGTFITRYGAIRVSQVCVLLCAASVALIASVVLVPFALVPVLVVAPLVMGLGYGPITPSSSQILARTASARRMALTFSIKQTGVPAGVALAGALLPGVALGIGWVAAFALVAALGMAIALLAQMSRASLDADRIPGHALSLAGIAESLRRVIGTPALRDLALVGLVFAALQVCLLSFLVIYLTETLGFSLVAAGFALTAMNVGGIAGRILWGAVADRYVRPRVLLGLIGIGAGICAGLTIAFDGTWPTLAMLAVCVSFGMTAIGWNGVQLAELARHAPAGHAGSVTGAAGFISFSGVVIAPPAFALISALTEGYRVAFATFGTLSALYGVRLLIKR